MAIRLKTTILYKKRLGPNKSINGLLQCLSFQCLGEQVPIANEFICVNIFKIATLMTAGPHVRPTTAVCTYIIITMEYCALISIPFIYRKPVSGPVNPGNYAACQLYICSLSVVYKRGPGNPGNYAACQ